MSNIRRNLTVIGCGLLALIRISFGCGKGHSQSGVASAATQPAPQPNQVAASQFAPTPTHLIIRKAVYGDLPDGAVEDVTEKIRAMVKDGMLSVAATDDNFGDPYNGKMRLTIERAKVRVPHINLGGEGGAGDFTDQVKRFQNGNALHMKISDGDMKVTVYYDYGDGKQHMAYSMKDGSLDITVPTKLRVDYRAANGVDTSETADIGQPLKIDASDPVQPIVNVAGTLWVVIDNDGDNNVQFRADGTLDWSDANGAVAGIWKQDGASIYMEINHYSRYEGTISNDRMSGSGSNDAGDGWTWSGQIKK
jgi:hypothetical protein